MSATEQKLREAFSRIRSLITDTTRIDSHTISLVIADCDQALALPTADHIPDAGEMVADHLPEAGKMIETAAPVGELPELPEAYGYFDIRGSAADGYTADQMRAYARAALSTQQSPFECTRSHPHEMMSPECALRTEIARLTNENARLKATPALSAGDAVDARRYRWLKGRSQVCLNQVWIGGYTTRQRDVDFLSKEDALSAIDTAIDEAMRKGQL